MCKESTTNKPICLQKYLNNINFFAIYGIIFITAISTITIFIYMATSIPLKPINWKKYVGDTDYGVTLFSSIIQKKNGWKKSKLNGIFYEKIQKYSS